MEETWEYTVVGGAKAHFETGIEMSEESFEAEVSTEGGKLSVRGEGVARIVDGLAGFLSPVTEGLGAIGDVIRVYRQKNAISALAEARELALKLNVPIRPVPPKFLVDWIEAVSLEDEASSVTKLWTGLLVSASNDTDSRLYMFKRILKEFGSRHVEFTEFMFDGNLQAELNHKKFLTAQRNFREYFKGYRRNFPSDGDIRGFMQKLANSGEGFAIRCMWAGYGQTSSSLGLLEDYEVFSEDLELRAFREDRTIDALKALGLIEEIEQKTELVEGEDSAPRRDLLSNKHIIDLRYVALTALGMDFVLACKGMLPNKNYPVNKGTVKSNPL